jgi:hypothetical protein
MPLFAFGMQNSLVKFFSQCKTEQEESRFLSLQFYCRFIVDSFIVDWVVFFDDISIYLSQKTQ